MEDKIKIIQDLVDRCEKCKLDECINCEISWIEVQIIKKEKEDNHKWYWKGDIINFKMKELKDRDERNRI